MVERQQRIDVVVAGAAGNMGNEAVRSLAADDRFRVVARLVRQVGNEGPGREFDDVEQLLAETSADVWLDLTDARSVVRHVDRALASGLRPVIGATGYEQTDLTRWQAVCQERHLGGIAAPNFAIGALLLMRFAADAAHYYEHAEIIELHHDGKRDAPSGTAVRTAQKMKEARLPGAQLSATAMAPAVNCQQNGQADRPPSPARGMEVSGTPIHSVRLQGLVAHQEVLFGGDGEVLTLRHDSLSRRSFMPGILLACERVCQLNQFVHGIEHLLW